MLKKVISNKILSHKKDFKYFINCKYGDKIKAFCIKLPNMSEYAKYFVETKHMNFLIKNGKFLEA